MAKFKVGEICSFKGVNKPINHYYKVTQAYLTKNRTVYNLKVVNELKNKYVFMDYNLYYITEKELRKVSKKERTNLFLDLL